MRTNVNDQHPALQNKGTFYQLLIALLLLVITSIIVNHVKKNAADATHKVATVA